MGINFIGCGGGGGGSDNSSNGSTVIEGVFLDSAVEGLNYKTDTQTGITDNNGTFKYQENEVITFSIGSIDLGQTTGKTIITPIDLVEGATDANNNQVINICRLLQTLDDDSNVDNGITITEIVNSAAKGISIDFNADVNQFDETVESDIDKLTSLTSAGQRELVSVNDAQDHINQIFQDDDGDGYTETEGDCNDSNADINPGETEICGDGIDQDCDGSDLACTPEPNDVDDDGDGYTETEGDCNDSNADINPGETEICGDGIDQDCDGSDLSCTPEPNDVAEQLWDIDVSFTGRSYSNEWSWENIKIAGSQEPLKTEYDSEYPFPYMHQYGGKTLVDTSFYDNTDGGLILAYYPEAYTYSNTVPALEGLALIKKGYCIDLGDLIVGDEPYDMAGDTYFSCGDEAIAPTWDGIQTSLNVAQEAAYIKHEAFTLHDTGRWFNDAGSSSLTITFTPVN
jgi:hypothetical protein